MLLAVLRTSMATLCAGGRLCTADPLQPFVLPNPMPLPPPRCHPRAIPTVQWAGISFPALKPEDRRQQSQWNGGTFNYCVPSCVGIGAPPPCAAPRVTKLDGKGRHYDTLYGAHPSVGRGACPPGSSVWDSTTPGIHQFNCSIPPIKPKQYFLNLKGICHRLYAECESRSRRTGSALVPLLTPELHRDTGSPSTIAPPPHPPAPCAPPGGPKATRRRGASGCIRRLLQQVGRLARLPRTSLPPVARTGGGVVVADPCHSLLLFNSFYLIAQATGGGRDWSCHASQKGVSVQPGVGVLTYVQRVSHLFGASGCLCFKL